MFASADDARGLGVFVCLVVWFSSCLSVQDYHSKTPITGTSAHSLELEVQCQSAAPESRDNNSWFIDTCFLAVSSHSRESKSLLSLPFFSRTNTVGPNGVISP
jgi:hypothetical protein